eukprot:15434601-Alexandrium_andersonii.AAC.1
MSGSLLRRRRSKLRSPSPPRLTQHRARAKRTRAKQARAKRARAKRAKRRAPLCVGRIVPMAPEAP